MSLSCRRYPQATSWRLEKLSPRVLTQQVLGLLQRYSLDPGECSSAPKMAPRHPVCSGGLWPALPRTHQPHRLPPVCWLLPLSSRSGPGHSRQWAHEPLCPPGAAAGRPGLWVRAAEAVSALCPPPALSAPLPCSPPSPWQSRTPAPCAHLRGNVVWTVFCGPSLFIRLREFSPIPR